MATRLFISPRNRMELIYCTTCNHACIITTIPVPDEASSIPRASPEHPPSIPEASWSLTWSSRWPLLPASRVKLHSHRQRHILLPLPPPYTPLHTHTHTHTIARNESHLINETTTIKSSRKLHFVRHVVPRCRCDSGKQKQKQKIPKQKRNAPKE